MKNKKYKAVTGKVSADLLIDEDAILLCQITEEDLESKYISKPGQLLELLKEHKIKRNGDKIKLLFPYDDDERELYEIDEVCEYMYLLFDKYRFLFYYLASEDQQALWAFYCLIGVVILSRGKDKTKVRPVDSYRAMEFQQIITQSVLQYGMLIDDVKGAQASVRNLFETN